MVGLSIRDGYGPDPATQAPFGDRQTVAEVSRYLDIARLDEPLRPETVIWPAFSRPFRASNADFLYTHRYRLNRAGRLAAGRIIRVMFGERRR